MAATNKSITVLASTARVTRLEFTREVIGGVDRVRATITGTVERSDGVSHPTKPASLLLPAGNSIATSVLTLMNGAALVQFRTENELET